MVSTSGRSSSSDTLQAGLTRPPELVKNKGASYISPGLSYISPAKAAFGLITPTAQLPLPQYIFTRNRMYLSSAQYLIHVKI
jgi:hypothetical protein